eukprot:gene34050-biopygen7167
MTGDGNADEPDTSTDSTTPAPVPNSPELAPQQTEVQLMNLKFANQQEQHAAAMKWSELQEGASTSKGDKEAAKTTGNAELELKKKLPTFPYAQGGGTDTVRAKLGFMKEKVNAGAEGVVGDIVMKKWLEEFDATKSCAGMTATAKQAAVSAKASFTRSNNRIGQLGVGRGRGAPSTPTPHLAGRPPKFDHGTSLRDLTEGQQQWLFIEKKQALESGARVRAHRRGHVSRVFLVPKLGTNKWRLVMDLRWLHFFCVKSRCKMETLKKLQRLASSGDWCFSFDLEDGYHAVGTNPDFLKFMQFDIGGELFQCGALPFVWRGLADWRGEISWVNPPWELLDEVAHKLREEDAAATVVAPYWPGQVWFRELEALSAELPVNCYLRERGVETMMETIEENDEMRPGHKIEIFWLVDQVAALQLSAAGNYEGHWRKFVDFCVSEGRVWLPATEATIRLYIAFPLKRVRRVHEAARRIVLDTNEKVELLRACVYVVVAFVTVSRPQTGTAMLRGSLLHDSSRLSVVLEKEKGRNHLLIKRRLFIPVDGVEGLHDILELWETAREEAWLRGAPTRTSRTAGTDSYWRLLWESGKQIKADVANVWIRGALQHVGCLPPEGGHYTAHSTRKGVTTCSRAVGVVMEKVCYFGGWSQLSSTVLAYIEPTAVVDNDMVCYFGWLAPGWRGRSVVQDCVE